MVISFWINFLLFTIIMNLFHCKWFPVLADNTKQNDLEVDLVSINNIASNQVCWRLAFVQELLRGSCCHPLKGLGEKNLIVIQIILLIIFGNG